MKPTNFAYHLTEYLSKYLPSQVGASTNTIKSYRDTFTLLLKFCKAEKGINPDRLTLKHLERVLVEDFLSWIEEKKKCSVSTRNQRLAAIHSFFRYLQIEAPENILSYQKVLAIPVKRYSRRTLNYLSLKGIKTILAMPDTGTLSGRRDLVLLCLLYDTGARVQEIADCTVGDVRLEDPANIRLRGKGEKSRIVPVMKQTALYIKEYTHERNLDKPVMRPYPLFYNRIRRKLTRAGITYILNKYVGMARSIAPEHIPDVVSPHSIRHSKAMHLLQAGVNLIYIRDLLGHVDIKTTEIYARADTDMKRKALENAYRDISPDKLPEWHNDSELMSWLKSLCS